MTAAALLAGITVCGLATAVPALATTTAPLSVATAYLPPGSANTSYSAQLAATGGTKPYQWSISDGALPAGLTLHAATGAITGKPTVTGTASFTVEVTDSETAPATASAAESITVTAPPLTVTTASLPTATADASYKATLAATGGVAPYTWLLSAGALPDGLTLHTNGTLSGTPTVTGTFSFTAEAADSDSPADTATASLSITVAAAPLVITTDGTLPTAQADTSYSVKLAADGGITPYTWSVESGDLPYGVTLKKTGTISGTPTGTGTYTVTVHVADSENPPATASQVLTLAVAAPLAITTTALPDGTIGANYSATLTATGGVTPYTWSLASGSSLPAGLTVNPNGTVSGTVGGSPGSYTFSVELTDSENPPVTTDQSFTINVIVPPLAITTTALPNATIGQAYSATLTATGGVTPYTWSLASGSSLPPGLTLNPSGTITGTVGGLVSSYLVTLAATDSENPSVTATEPVVINAVAAPLSFATSTTLADATVGETYSATLTATGGVGPYTWSDVSGFLPGGLTLNPSTGVISGTEEEGPGPYVATIEVSDSQDPAATAEQTFTINVLPSPVPIILTLGPLTAQAGTSYSQPLLAIGGDAPYTWSVVSGSSLPSGLTLDPSAGVISGTPQEPGSYTFTIQAADSGTPPATGDRTYTMTVTPAAQPAVSTTALPTAVAGTSYTATLTATGGVAPYTWSLASGSSLPAGLTVNPDGTISGTVEGQAGSYTVTVEAVDSEAPAQDASATFTMTVVSQITFPGSGSLPDGSVGDSYGATLTADGGIPPYTWVLASGSSLPSGLTLDPSTGVISGTVGGSAGFYTFTVAVTDATPQTATETLTMTVESSITFGSGALPDGIVGDSYSAALTATGGIAPYTWAFGGGSLPPGLTVNPGGSVSGTVGDAPGSYTFTAAVTDAAGLTAGDTLTINVVPPVSISTTPLPNADAGPTEYTATLTATGGVGPYTWTLASGSSLPAGLSLGSSTGVISGDPGETGSFTFTIVATDSENPAATDEHAFTLDVVPPPDITSGALTATDDTEYSGTLTVADGVGPYTWALGSGSSLPSGLSLDPSTGVISGLLAVAVGTYSFEVSVTDSEGAKESALVQFTVQSPL